MTSHLATFILLSTTIAPGAVIDRIAGIAGNRVIKLTDIGREIRITAFLNQEKSYFTPEARRKAAERLVDQEMIRREIESGQYSMAGEEEANQLLQQLRRERYRSDGEFRDALSSYGITQELLLEKLRWQITVLRFIEMRFQLGAQTDTAENSRDRSKKVDEQFEAWLEQARKNVRVELREEAFRTP